MSSIQLLRPLLRTTRRLQQSSTALRWHSSAASGEASVTEGEQNIINKLTQRFNPSKLQVQDVSGGCGTFYAIAITSSEFKGLTTLKQHRLVTTELKQEVANIHGLQLKTVPE
ncbi:bola-like protein [Clavulina sp. PMI_390]|nr:bola-like protein [Clavulina sp. PMI_390]